MGELQAEDEVPMGGDAMLEVAVLDGDVVYTTFDLVEDDGGTVQDELAVLACPATLSVSLSVTLAAQGFPTFEGTVPATVQAENQDPGTIWNVYASVDPRDDLDGPLTEPTSFDPSSVDRLAARLLLSGHADTRGVALSWLGETDDGQGEDGGASIRRELVYMAQLNRSL
ncbi:MAG: hypothetical protein AAGA48_08550 [Myxococcota bacterium]